MRSFQLACLSLAAWALSAQTAPQIEPKAGNWKTWAISSGKDYRVSPPPDAAATRGELEWLRGASADKNPQIADQISFWDSGSPGYRWLEILASRSEANQPLSPYPVRPFAYLNMAIYDATIAAWESKYFYNRPRPNQLDPTLRTALPTPNSPSYPSEHAVAAGAAAAVLSYFYPAEAAYFQSLAEEAGRSRIYAGLQYPSDYTAGMELGRKVAAKVIALAMADGSDAVWSGTVPAGKCMWVGVNPGNVAATTWKPLLLSSASEFRPPPPPACDSPEVTEQVTNVRTFPRTFITNYKSFYWQSPEGLNTWPYVYANKWMYEDKFDQNPPRAARANALLGAVFYDAFIASQDAKFTYWYIRPHQLDTAIVPLFAVPNFPSYPSNHSTFSAARSEILAYLFPKQADAIRAVGKEAGDSRIWAGIHYEMDNQAGVKLGRSVAQKFIAWANSDGSQ
jgi:membrane-associated phospholipid phosphatase